MNRTRTALLSLALCSLRGSRGRRQPFNVPMRAQNWKSRRSMPANRRAAQPRRQDAGAPRKRFGALALAMSVATAVSAASISQSHLADAAERSDQTSIRALLKQRVDLNAPQVDGMTALHWASYRDDLETARLLLKAGARAPVTNHYGVSPLYLACLNGNTELVALLLEAGADANRTLRGG